MASVSECIVKLVKAGTITQDIADEALGLHERMQGQYRREGLGPADADAQAALTTAKIMATGAREIKYSHALQVERDANFEKNTLAHPRGRVAGFMSQMVSDIWNKSGLGGQNVETRTSVHQARFSAMFSEGMAAYQPGVLGRTQEQLAGSWRMVGELFHVNSGDATAKAAAAGLKRAIDEGVALAKSAGKIFKVIEDWRLPQPWTSERMQMFPVEEFKRDVQTHIDSGGILNVWDRDINKPTMTVEHRDQVLARMWRDVRTNDTSIGTFSPEMRTIEFADGQKGFDAYKGLQEKYGVGENLMGMIVGHLNKMARDVALTEIISPNHAATVARIMPLLKEEEGNLSKLQRYNPIRALENARIAQNTYDVLTGRANVVDGQLMAGIFGGVRSLAVSSKLGGAVITSFFGDSVTTGAAAAHVGMAPSQMIEAITRELSRGGAESKAIAGQMNLIAHAGIEYAHGFRGFSDDLSGPQALRWLATSVIKASGLEAWTNLIKRTFSMEMMAHLNNHSMHDFAALRGANKPLADMLERHQISPAEWDKIRMAEKLDLDGIKFSQVATIGDRALEDKLLGAIVHERRYAMLEPDARIRAIITGGQHQGTFHGEMGRSFFLFKSFSMTMTATHVMRLGLGVTEEGKVGQAVLFGLFAMFAGAMTLQTKNIIYGKDPEAMNTASFWGKSLLTGGGLGILGDLTQAAFTRSGRSAFAELAGPVGGLGEDILKLTSGQTRRWYEGEDTTFGAEAVKVAKRWTPNLYFTRLAQERLMWDKIQMLADPDYRGSWKRMEQRMKRDNDQEFWFRPGQTTPGRAPNLGAAFGG